MRAAPFPIAHREGMSISRWVFPRPALGDTPPSEDIAILPQHHEPDHLPGEPPPGSGFALAGLWMLLFWALVAILAIWLFPRDAASSNTPSRDAAGRIVIDGLGGGTFRWGYDTAERHWRRGDPIRLEGTYTSAGTFLLWSVEQLPGSCVDRAARFEFHEPVQTSGMLLSLISPVPIMLPFTDPEERVIVLEQMTRPYNPALTQWYYDTVVGHPPSSFFRLQGEELGRFGYPICA